MLSHEHKIPTKIEVWARDDQQFESSAETKLGHFSLSDNTQRNYTLREMKTIAVRAAAALRTSQY